VRSGASLWPGRGDWTGLVQQGLYPGGRWTVRNLPRPAHQGGVWPENLRFRGGERSRHGRFSGDFPPPGRLRGSARVSAAGQRRLAVGRSRCRSSVRRPGWRFAKHVLEIKNHLREDGVLCLGQSLGRLSEALRTRPAATRRSWTGAGSRATRPAPSPGGEFTGQAAGTASARGKALTAPRSPDTQVGSTGAQPGAKRICRGRLCLIYWTVV
jgi:hypothetical protein